MKFSEQNVNPLCLSKFVKYSNALIKTGRVNTCLQATYNFLLTWDPFYPTKNLKEHLINTMHMKHFSKNLIAEYLKATDNCKLKLLKSYITKKEPLTKTSLSI